MSTAAVQWQKDKFEDTHSQSSASNDGKLVRNTEVLSSLIHRACTLYDADSHQQKLDFLNNVFEQNGYNDRQIKQAMEPARVTP